AARRTRRSPIPRTSISRAVCRMPTRPSRSSASITSSGSVTDVGEGSRRRTRRRRTPEGATRTAARPDLLRGTSAPLGATPGPAGANFSAFSRHATGIELLLFARVDDAKPSRVIRIDAAANRTYHYWHVFVPGVTSGQLYGYRVDGPSDPGRGMRFDPAKVLLDPYGRGVAVPTAYSRDAAS